MQAYFRDEDPLDRAYKLFAGPTLARERFTVWIVSVFAILALTIAAIGVYGVVSYSVTGRTREIGVRVALGATDMAVIRLVFGETLALLTVGLAGGFAISLAAGGVIRALLFETAPTDALTYVFVSALLAAVGVLAQLRAHPCAVGRSRHRPSVRVIISEETEATEG